MQSQVALTAWHCWLLRAHKRVLSTLHSRLVSGWKGSGLERGCWTHIHRRDSRAAGFCVSGDGGGWNPHLWVQQLLPASCCNHSCSVPGTQISCFSPANFTGKQSAYVDTSCWDSLIHYEFDAAGNTTAKSLWTLKAFPYSLLLIAVAMYLPSLLWRYTAAPALNSDLLFIIDELDKSYNRSIRLVQHMVKVRQASTDARLFWEEFEKARRERYFEFPLLERYLACKQRSHSLVGAYLLRNLLLLLLIAATCFYLGFLHLHVFFQDEFSCSIKTGLLRDEPQVPDVIPCKLVFFSVFQLISLSNGGVYVLLAPVVIYNMLQLLQWDKRLLSIYEMLPAFDLLSRKMLTCPLNDLNILLLFLQANISELKSFSRLNAVCALREVTSSPQHIDTVVDFMTLLAGLETSKPKHPACAAGAEGNPPPPPSSEILEMKPTGEAKRNADPKPSPPGSA
ncbi:pannexin-3 isoform X1 [Malaclemys terrapin pileata]|uniref:pannexin-3 isoform X1 n=1 Tax=Malaclemys terrapin pileata TaxID=2991368 RepID=UPI0023A87131|nr:pannexin-3 isoform X1 [Malaclemys terrapin pileata]